MIVFALILHRHLEHRGWGVAATLKASIMLTSRPPTHTQRTPRSWYAVRVRVASPKPPATAALLAAAPAHVASYRGGAASPSAEELFLLALQINCPVDHDLRGAVVQPR